MTGTIEGAYTHPGEGRGAEVSTSDTDRVCLLEQAKGVLIFRYGIGGDQAHRLLQLWAVETDSSVRAVAHALVHEICQGRGTPSDVPLVRALEARLRRELPDLGGLDRLGPAADSGLVIVAVDHSETSLDRVVEGAREAERRGAPLELTVDASTLAEGGEMSRAKVVQQLDLAVELARSVAPAVEVRLPRDNPLHPA